MSICILFIRYEFYWCEKIEQYQDVLLKSGMQGVYL